MNHATSPPPIPQPISIAQNIITETNPGCTLASSPFIDCLYQGRDSLTSRNNAHVSACSSGIDSDQNGSCEATPHNHASFLRSSIIDNRTEAVMPPCPPPNGNGIGTANPPGATKPKLGTYEIDRTIGKGMFSIVKLATHTITGLKVMETPRLLCMVMEFLPNGEVFDYIAKYGRFSEAQARIKFMDVVSALHYTHSYGVVHRDLKAENLLFDANMNIKLIDFSFGTYYSSDSSQQPLLTTWCGSPPYAAPEIFKGEPYVGVKADIWSLGVVLYVMVCGTLPFDAQPLPHLRNQVLSASFRVPYWLSTTCERLIRVMLSKQPSKRPTTEEIAQHPWFTLPTKLLPPNLPMDVDMRPINAVMESGTSHIGTVDNATRSISLSIPPLGDGEKSQIAADSGPDLAADVELGKVNDFVILIMESYGMRRSQILESLGRCAYDHLMATYLLLGEKVRSHRYSLSVLHNLTHPSIPEPITTQTYTKSSCVDSAVDVKSGTYSEYDSSSRTSLSSAHCLACDSLVHESSSIYYSRPRDTCRTTTAHSYQTRVSVDLPRQRPHYGFPLLDTNDGPSNWPPVQTSTHPMMIDQSTTEWRLRELEHVPSIQQQKQTTPPSASPAPMPPLVPDVDMTMEANLVDSLGSCEPPAHLTTFNISDQLPEPWLTDTGATISGDTGQIAPLKRTLVRRKYGVYTPPDCLDELARVMNKQRSPSPPTPNTSNRPDCTN